MHRANLIIILSLDFLISIQTLSYFLARGSQTPNATASRSHAPSPPQNNRRGDWAKLPLFSPPHSFPYDLNAPHTSSRSFGRSNHHHHSPSPRLIHLFEALHNHNFSGSDQVVFLCCQWGFPMCNNGGGCDSR